MQRNVTLRLTERVQLLYLLAFSSNQFASNITCEIGEMESDTDQWQVEPISAGTMGKLSQVRTSLMVALHGAPPSRMALSMSNLRILVIYRFICGLDEA